MVHFFSEKLLNYSVFLKSSMIFIFQMLFSIQYIHSMLRASLIGPLALISIKIILFFICLCHIGNVRRQNWILSVEGLLSKGNMHSLTLIKVMLPFSSKKLTKITKNVKNIFRCLIKLNWLICFPLWEVIIHKNKIIINKSASVADKLIL